MSATRDHQNVFITFASSVETKDGLLGIIFCDNQRSALLRSETLPLDAHQTAVAISQRGERLKLNNNGSIVIVPWRSSCVSVAAQIGGS